MTDYKSSHLQWIHSTKSFVPKYSHDYVSASYLEVMKNLYANVNCTQDHAKSFFVSDKLWHKQTFLISKAIDKDIEKLVPTSSEWWFVTIGFNHDTWNIVDCDKCIRKILEMDWIISGKANFELFRTNGEHPHVHFCFKTKEPKSRILDKLFRPLYVKKVVFSKNFIDVKPMMKYHYNYIQLIKVLEKMECVEKDKKWRTENNILDYEKNIDQLNTLGNAFL